MPRRVGALHPASGVPDGNGNKSRTAEAAQQCGNEPAPPPAARAAEGAPHGDTEADGEGEAGQPDEQN